MIEFSVTELPGGHRAAGIPLQSGLDHEYHLEEYRHEKHAKRNRMDLVNLSHDSFFGQPFCPCANVTDYYLDRELSFRPRNYQLFTQEVMDAKGI